MPKLRPIVLSVMVLAAVTAVGASDAHAVAIATDPSITDTIPGLTGFSTTGADMDGMSVTASFEGGFLETLSWADTGAQSGGVTGTGWSLSLSGDSFDNPWSFVNTRNEDLVSLVLDGTTGLTVFDIIANVGGTPGSATGRPFSETPTATGTATYSRQVAIGANAPVGDLWHVLTVDFTGGVAGNFTFLQDTDNDSRQGTAVPEPGTLLLVSSGFAGVAALARRRRS